MADRIYPQLINEAPLLDLTGRRKMVMTLDLHSASISTASGAAEIPTVAKIGPFKGFSLPIWAATGATAYEELYTNIRLPDILDPRFNATLKLFTCLSGTEASGTKFRFVADWKGGVDSSSISTSSDATEYSDDIVLSAAEATYASHQVDISISIADSIGAGVALPSDLWIGGRIRQVAPSTGKATAANEIVVLGAALEFTIDKLFAQV